MATEATAKALKPKAHDPALDQIIKLAIMAVGGQGGGVLTNWIEDCAHRNGYVVQATSVAGVAQRTGCRVGLRDSRLQFDQPVSGRGRGRHCRGRRAPLVRALRDRTGSWLGRRRKPGRSAGRVSPPGRALRNHESYRWAGRTGLLSWLKLFQLWSTLQRP